MAVLHRLMEPNQALLYAVYTTAAPSAVINVPQANFVSVLLPSSVSFTAADLEPLSALEREECTASGGKDFGKKR
jgi:hypothetical protein